MAKWCNSAMLDAALNYIKNNVTRLEVCKDQPATVAQATGTLHVASTTISSEDFTLANGDTSGRKVTVAAKNGLNIDVVASGTHIALLDVSSNTLYYVTTVSPLWLITGGTVNVGSWKIEIADPT